MSQQVFFEERYFIYMIHNTYIWSLKVVLLSFLFFFFYAL